MGGREGEEGNWGGGGGGKGKDIQADWAARNGFEMEKNKNTTASPIKEKFFLFCFFGHGQSVTLAFVECVMNYTAPLLLLCLCCGEAPAVCTSYNILRCEFSMPVYQPGFFWTGIEKWLFEESLWWWAQFVFTAKKFVWTLWNVGWRQRRGSSWEACCLPVRLFRRVCARMRAACNQACMMRNEKRMQRLWLTVCLFVEVNITFKQMCGIRR